MDLVDRHRLAAGFAPSSFRHVLGVGPGEVGTVGDDRGGRGPQFRLEAERVGFERQKPAVRPGQFIFIDRSGGQVRDENLPQAAVVALSHLAAAAVPAVEIADDGAARRVRRPEREQHAVDAFVLGQLGAESPVELTMRAFAQEVVVDGTERRTEGIGIDVRRGSVSSFHLNSITRLLLGRGDQRLEKVVLAPGQFGDHLAGVARQRPHAHRVGRKDPDHPTIGEPMRAQHGKGIAAPGGLDRDDVLFARPPSLHFILPVVAASLLA